MTPTLKKDNQVKKQDKVRFTIWQCDEWTMGHTDSISLVLGPLTVLHNRSHIHPLKYELFLCCSTSCHSHKMEYHN
uniref:Uncharacterized protein n=1 Tax=Echeneis naucrates TaxID=173247 RepID=A0A665W3F9_ECHNA